jgi:phosphinothricin acetyltransferase
MDIRDASAADIPGITRIYNDAVLTSTAIWNTSVVDEANRAAWLEDRAKLGYPVLVALDADGGVAGYGSFGDWRAWEGYRHTVEHSVYVRADQRGKGLGEALTQALIARARDCGKHVIVAGIEAGNVASIRLHEKLGFEKTGHLKEVGTKFGRWLDLAFLQLRLDPEAPNDRLRGGGAQTL